MDDLECVETKGATEEQNRSREVNSGTYWFKAADLLQVLTEINQITPKNII